MLSMTWKNLKRAPNKTEKTGPKTKPAPTTAPEVAWTEVETVVVAAATDSLFSDSTAAVAAADSF